MAKIAQRQVLATIGVSPFGAATKQFINVQQNLPNWGTFKFAQVSGGEITASVEKIYEGGKSRPTVLCAPSEIGDITLTAHYDDDMTESLTDSGIGYKIQKLRRLVGLGFYDITVSVYDCDIKDPTNDRIYYNALLVGLTEAEGDSSSGAPATFALTFAISDVQNPVRQTS
jgi:hypothetical protein